MSEDRLSPEVEAWLDDNPMSAEEARRVERHGPWACACVGPPVELRGIDAPCYCALVWEQVRRALNSPP